LFRRLPSGARHGAVHVDVFCRASIRRDPPSVDERGWTPVADLGTFETKLLADGWTVVTKDRQLSGQFEHTVGVTDDGCEVFTLSPAGKHHPVW